MDISKRYWFLLSPAVYVAYESNPEKVLLYHTQSGRNIESEENICIQLIKDAYLPDNNGVSEIIPHKLKNIVFTEFLLRLIEVDFCSIQEIQEGIPRPVNLLPILRIERDIENDIEDANFRQSGYELLNYLVELNLYIQGDCSQNCTLCKEYNKQVLSCTKDEDIILPSSIEDILDQVVKSNVKKINILGGNIFLYPYWKELSAIIKKYCFNFHYWVNEKNILEEHTPYFYPTDIVFTPPIKAERIQRLLKSGYNASCFHFLIEDYAEYETIEQSLSGEEEVRYKVLPVYNGKNDDFFNEYIFLDKEDLLSEVKSMREIFRDQKVNINYFGKLYIYSDGSVKAAFDGPVLCSIYKGSFPEAIYREIQGKSFWRKTRNYGECANCFYNYICSPPSGYEKLIGKTNLCHVK